MIRFSSDFGHSRHLSEALPIISVCVTGLVLADCIGQLKTRNQYPSESQIDRRFEAERIFRFEKG